MRLKSISLIAVLVLCVGGLAAQEFQGVSRSKAVKIVPPGYEETTPEEAEPEAAPVEVLPTSDVDIDIPTAAALRPDAVGVVIGITEYAHQDVPDVDFARRDAHIMRDYLVQAMGYREENIIMAVDQQATQAAFNRIFEGQLRNYIKPGISDVFVYYSGHGAPDVDNVGHSGPDASGSGAYFVPHDADPNYAAQTGYSLDQFYTQLNELEARSITVVVDACFSGGSEAGMLIQQASPIFISVENPAANLKNGVVLTSSSGDQISSWYQEKGHGLFTYFFLKGIRGEADGDADGKVTTNEVFGYVMENVPYLARRIFNREQTPQLMGAALEQVLVEY